MPSLQFRRMVARRRLSAISSTFARDVSATTLLQSARRRTLRIPRERRIDRRQTRRRLKWYPLQLLLQGDFSFAGRPRQGDMTDCLQQLASGYEMRMTCVDIQRRPSIDLANSKRAKLLARIRAEDFDAILLSPPCSTFSRAPWSNFKRA